MRNKTLATIPGTLFVLLVFSCAIWLLSRSGLPQQYLIYITAATCVLALGYLYRRNDLAVQRQIIAIKKGDLDGNDDSSS